MSRQESQQNHFNFGNPKNRSQLTALKCEPTFGFTSELTNLAPSKGRRKNSSSILGPLPSSNWRLHESPNHKICYFCTLNPITLTINRATLTKEVYKRGQRIGICSRERKVFFGPSRNFFLNSLKNSRNSNIDHSPTSRDFPSLD